MKIETKTSFILLITLLIGMAIGFLLNMVFLSRKVDQFRNLHQTRGFIHLFEGLIEPTESQHDTLQQVLKTYYQRFHDLRMQHIDELRTLIDSLQTDLMPILTEEQKRRLNKKRRMFEHRSRRFLPMDAHPGGPPAGPPVLTPRDSGKRPPFDRSHRMKKERFEE